jgi:hypothetical protein
VTDQRPPLEKWLDVLLYAPVGLVSCLRTEVPRYVSDGRQKVEQRVQVARWIGQMTVAFGKQELEKRLERPVEPDLHPEPVELTQEPLAQHAPEPFDGYASMPAAHIVQRLARLPHSELHLVRAYETANRRRRTVLAKVDQLLGD